MTRTADSIPTRTDNASRLTASIDETFARCVDTVLGSPWSDGGELTDRDIAILIAARSASVCVAPDGFFSDLLIDVEIHL